MNYISILECSSDCFYNLFILFYFLHPLSPSYRKAINFLDSYYERKKLDRVMSEIYPISNPLCFVLPNTTLLFISPVPITVHTPSTNSSLPCKDRVVFITFLGLVIYFMQFSLIN